MYLLMLEKDLRINKMKVVSWEFINKNDALSMGSIPGVSVVVAQKDIPTGFFTSHKDCYYEDGHLVFIKQ